MAVEIFEFDQGSSQWFAIRAGLPTSSEFSTILAKGRDGGVSVTRRKYMLRLAGEILTGEPEQTYSNGFMERGKEWEPEARNLYAFMQGVEPRQVGFVRNGKKGCSPDSLIEADGALEIKSALPSVLLDLFERDTFPAEHKAQCQGALWVTEREWIDIVVYHPKLPLYRKRAVRDEPYIAELSAAVDKFNDELAALVERMRRVSEARAA